MVTSRDVAAAAGVSQATVSRVLADAATVSETTRARVLAAVEQVGYVPNLTARTMKTGRTGTVGVVVADLTNPFYPQLLEALGRALDAAGRRLSVWVADGPKNSAALQAIRERSVDGVVFTTVVEESAELRSALDRQSPLVLVNRLLPEVACDQVGSDNVAGGALVAQYLLAHGRRRIAFLGGEPSVSTTRDRLTGFRDHLAAAGAPLAAAAHGTYTYASGRAGALQLLTDAAPPDALFCSNDLLAFGALDAARERGLRVPEDLWVVGYDDVEQAGWGSMSLTTVRQDVDRLAATAAELLLARMDSPGAPPRHVTLEPELRVRGSTAHSPG
jgi:LacI family transcriptional regulator